MNKHNNLLTALGDMGEYHGWEVVQQAIKERQTIHVAVMAEPFLTYLLEGKKTIESRFSQHAIPPFGRIKTGDLVLLKRSGGPVIGCFVAGEIIEARLADVGLHIIKSVYGKAICADEPFWRTQIAKRYVTLISVTDVREIQPLPLAKKDRRGWVTYDS